MKIGRQSVASMNYFHRKTYLHLLERRDTIIQQQQEQYGRARTSREYASSPQAESQMMDLPSPETVHGSPQALTRA